MNFPHRFYQLPVQFDAERLAKEFQQFDSSEWMPHPSGLKGNFSLPIVSRDGEDNYALTGMMKPCPRLKRMPYTQQVLSYFNTVIVRARFMVLQSGKDVVEHSIYRFIGAIEFVCIYRLLQMRRYVFFVKNRK